MSLAFAAAPACSVANGNAREPHRRCVSMMRERLGEAGLTALDVAHACALSLRSLHRAFAAEGRTFAATLLALRLAEAQRMLADRRFAGLSVAEIGRRCGYAEASHFARRFRQVHGLSPSAFRVWVAR